jgi:hypothetical protein
MRRSRKQVSTTRFVLRNCRLGSILSPPGTNLILWIPRSTRGWSWGTAVIDPRTGEILKAIVRLDAMRLRADQLLFDGLTDPYADRPDLAARDEALRQRLRILVAHEIGHTLGLRMGSAQGNSSVMDYPFPQVAADSNGAPVLKDAFPAGVGAWEKRMISYGCRPFDSKDEAQGLRQTIAETERAGLEWMTGNDAGDAHPRFRNGTATPTRSPTCTEFCRFAVWPCSGFPDQLLRRMSHWASFRTCLSPFISSTSSR